MVTDKSIKQLTARDKPYKKLDDQGLYVLVNPIKKKDQHLKKPPFIKSFLFRYKFDGKDKTKNIGRYPKVSLVEARKQRDECIDLLLQGIDPNAEIEIEEFKSFNVVADEWIKETNKSMEWSAKTLQTNQTRLNYAKQSFGEMDITKVTPQIVLAMCRVIEARGSIEAAKRTRNIASLVFRYAMIYDVAEPVKDALLHSVKRNHPHLLKEDELKQLHIDLDNNDKSSFEVAKALKFLSYTFVRQKELRGAKWDEITGEMWTVPGARTKNGEVHLVPLSTQALALLEDLRFVNGNKTYIFGSHGYGDNKPMSESTLGRNLNRMGYLSRQTPHGFRHTASTWLNELGYSSDAIELQLMHVIPGTRGIYNKAEKIDQRVVIMQAWADWVDDL